MTAITYYQIKFEEKKFLSNCGQLTQDAAEVKANRQMATPSRGWRPKGPIALLPRQQLPKNSTWNN